MNSSEDGNVKMADDYDLRDSVTKKRYKKLPGSAGIKGTDYQIKLLKYFLLRAYQIGEHFTLSTEVQEIAQNFDDVVYETDEKTILLQAKVRRNTINFQKLFPINGKGDFSIYTYLNGFPEIDKHFKNIKHIILCTESTFLLENINNSLNQEIKKTQAGPEYLQEKREVNFVSSIGGQTKCSSFNGNHTQILAGYIFQQNKSISKDNIKLFLDKLVLASVMEEDLEKQIESLSFDKTPVLKSISDDVETWFKNDTALPLRKNDVYQKISEYYVKSRAKQLSLLSDEYINGTSRGNYPNNPDGNIFLFKVDNIETCDLHIFKLHQMLLKDLIFVNKINGNPQKILIVDPQADIRQKKGIIEAFQMDKYLYLIIPIVNSESQTEIIDIINIQQIRKNKKILIISDRAIQLAGMKEYKVKIKLENLSKETREKILQYKINFQGNKMNLENIIHKKENIVDEFTLLQIILKKELSLNNNLKKSEQMTNYIPRKLLFNKYEELSEDEFFKRILEEFDRKVAVIVDSPGMGKSTILNKMDVFLRKSPHWTIKLNLNECSSILSNISKEKQTNITIEDLLPEYSEKSELETVIYNMSNNVIILLDALDEISPNYTDLVLNLVKNMSSKLNIRKIVITTRPHILSDIDEKQIKYEKYALGPFTDDDVIACLSTFWYEKFNKQYDKIKNFASKLKKELFKEIKWQNIEMLIGVPLKTKMIAEIFTEHCKNYLENGGNKIDLPANADINWLYDEFIKRKRDIYIEEKCKAHGNAMATEALKKSFNEAIDECTKHALKLIFPFEEDFFETINTPSSCVEKTLLIIGLMEKADKDVQFIHKTFAEYLSAKYVCDLVLKNKVSSEFLKKHSPELWFEPFFVSKFGEIFEILINNGHPVNVSDVFGLTSLHYAAKSKNKQVVEILLNRGLPVDIGDKNGRTPLHYAVLDGNKEIVKLLLNKDHPVDVRTKNGTTPLHYAALSGNRNIFEILLNKGHPVDVKDENGTSPLHYAAESGKKDIVQILLSKGHPVDIRDRYGSTSLHYAAKNRSNEVVEILLNKGHPVHVRDKNGTTPLHYASQSGKKKIVQMFLNKGHPIDVRDENFTTPLHYAALNKNKKIVEILLNKGHPIDVKDKYGSTSLHYAAKSRSNKIVEILLNKGHPVHVRDENGRTPLHYAARSGKKEVVEILLNKGHPVDVGDKYGTTPLHYAADSGKKEIVEILLNKGHPVDVKDKYGSTSLHYATKSRSTEIVEILLNKGHPVHVRDKNGTTPLHYAARSGKKEVVEILLKKGHPVNIKDKNGETPLHYLVKRGNKEVVEILLNKGHLVDVRDENGTTPLHCAARSGKKEVVELLLNKGHPVDIKDENGETPLHYLTKRGNKEVVEILLNKCHRVDVRANNGTTPLHYAAQNGNKDIFEMLLNKGHPIDIRGENGKTPLHYAAESGTKEVVEILLNKGHPVGIKDENGKTPLHYAAKWGKKEVVEILLNEGNP